MYQKLIHKIIYTLFSITVYHLMNIKHMILKHSDIKQSLNLWELYVNFITFYQDLHCSSYIKPLSGPISITATLFTTNVYYLHSLTGAIKGTSKDKLYEELGLESMQYRR